MPANQQSAVSGARVEAIQGLLLPLAPRQLCEQIGLNWWAAGQLHVAGFLSFNPEAVERLDERQEVELRFVGALVAAGCEHAMLTRLLAGLEKPYCYRPGRVYYDWAAQSWQLLPEPPEEPEKPDPDEVLSDWISSLEEDADADTLQHIKDKATAALTRLGSSPSS
jgi:hypothetical protein